MLPQFCCMRSNKSSLSVTSKFFFVLAGLIGIVNFSRAEDLTAVSPTTSDFPTISKLQKQKSAGTQEPIVLLHQKWTHRTLNVCATYEMPWQDSVVLAKISSYQEPGCASIKASFSF